MPNWWPLRLGRARRLPPSATRKGWLRRAKNVSLMGIVLGLGLWAAIALRIPGENNTFELDHPSPISVTANEAVVFTSERQTEALRTVAESSEENLVRVRDFTLPTTQRLELRQLLLELERVRDDAALSYESKIARITQMPSTSVTISQTVAANVLALNEQAWNSLRLQSLETYDRAMVRYNYDISQETLAQLRDREIPYWTSDMPPRQRELVLFFMHSFLRANSTLDLEKTAAKKEAARNAVQPVVVRIQKGESVVRQGDPVRAETLEKLEALGFTKQPVTGLTIAGHALLALMLALVFGFYLIHFQPAIAERRRPLVAITGLIICTVALARLLLPLWADWAYAFPLATAVMVLAVLFNGPLALVAAGIMSIALGAMANDSLSLTATMFLGAGSSVFLLRRAEHSLTFLLAGVAVALATAATQIAFASQDSDVRWSDMLPIIEFSGMNGALSAILSLGMFHLIGRVAGVVTPIQLMELAHPNQPLLRKLIREAPGTYYHSVSVGNLAESAAEAIDADALLLRVAAYYHDIGKTIRPYFFTDNQTDRENVHDELDPRISAEIIADHVREGVKMAQAARLPQPIVDFIATHHGTSVIRNFYQIALQREDSVNVEDYRYPGPRPFTREQGILMLADSVEATVRSKAQHGKLLHARANEQERAQARPDGRMTLEDLVGSIIEERLRSGQLDETPLTLRDLAQIKQAFVTSLQGIYHPRADYAPQIVRA
jgi:putative nucleotidyltransferase with HDIG domain